MGRKSLKPDEKKIKFSIRINPKLFELLKKHTNNKSKYIENLLYKKLD